MERFASSSLGFDSLAKLGLTLNESKIFIYLATNPGSNGYEISKNTGISRSLVYGSLEKMKSNGLIELMQTNSSSYVLKPLDEIEDIVRNDINDAFVKLNDVLANIKPQATDDLFISIPDQEQQKAKLNFMVRKVKRNLFISAGMKEIEWIKEELLKLPNEINVYIFSLAKLPGLPERFCIYSKGMEDNFIQSLKTLKDRWRILLIKDQEEMMLCGGDEKHYGAGIYTKNNMMVTFASEHFVHDVKISNIEKNYSIQDDTEKLLYED